MLKVRNCVAPIRVGVVRPPARKERARICCVPYLIATLASECVLGSARISFTSCRAISPISFLTALGSARTSIVCVQVTVKVCSHIRCNNTILLRVRIGCVWRHREGKATNAIATLADECSGRWSYGKRTIRFQRWSVQLLHISLRADVLGPVKRFHEATHKNTIHKYKELRAKDPRPPS